MSITTAGRSLSANMVTEVSASQLSPILLASFSFSTPVRLWSGYGTITVGITDHAQELLGDLVFVELPDVGKTLAAGVVTAILE